jgi:Photoprotection regulator fluorescence recovery protein
MGKPKIKPNYRRRSLRLPDLDHCKRAVLNSLGSPASRRVYEYAIDQFIAWYCSEPRLAFNRIVVVRYRLYLESRGLAANTINQQLAAVRRLAHEAADADLLSPELAAGISRVKGVKRELHEVIQQTQRMASQIQRSSDLWDLEHYLTQRRKEIDRKYEYHYSRLTDVLGRLLYENRLSEEELRGLREDKMESIRSFARFLKNSAA